VAGSGQIREIHEGLAQKPAVILLQDIHLNEEAQRGLARMLENITSEARRRSLSIEIGVEGAFHPFEFNAYRAFKDRKLVRDVADAFLHEARIGAPSYFGLVGASPLPSITGVEEPAHYKDNVEAYLSAEKSIPQVAPIFDGKADQLEREKSRVLNPELRVFEAAQSSYRSGSLPLGEFIEKMGRWADLSNSDPELQRFRQAYRLERSIDFSAAERQRTIVLEKLVGHLSAAEIRELTAMGISYKAGEILYADYYRALWALLEKHRLDLSAYPAFMSYLRYVLLVDGFSGAALLAAERKLETGIESRLCRTAEEKRLVGQARVVDLARRLVKFSLTPEEWQEYLSVRADLSSFSGLPSLSSFERFYSDADQRSHDMASRILGASPRANILVLVAGGFHTPLLSQLLKSQGIPFAIVQPNLRRIDSDQASGYLSVFTREKVPLERLFRGEKLFIAPYKVALGSNFPGADEIAARTLGTLSVLSIVEEGVLPPETRPFVEPAGSPSAPEARVRMGDEQELMRLSRGARRRYRSRAGAAADRNHPRDTGRVAALGRVAGGGNSFKRSELQPAHLLYGEPSARRARGRLCRCAFLPGPAYLRSYKRQACHRQTASGGGRHPFWAAAGD